MTDLFQDLRYAVRTLRKNLAFTLVALLALALGIGANSTIFITVNAMLLRPLPFHDLGRVTAVWGTAPRQHEDRLSVSPADFRDWSEQSTSFEALAAGHGWDANLTGDGLPERLEGYQVTAQFFSVLDMPPMLGRTFTPEEQQPGRADVVVLSYALWKNRFHNDGGIIGRPLTLNGKSMTVAGVMPREFDYPMASAIWAPIAFTPEQQSDRENGYLRVIGRLRPGVSAEKANTELNGIAARIGREFPRTNAGHGVSVTPIARDLNRESAQFILLLMAAAGLVLLLACANVANQQLARATGRQKELALRCALGASRGRIARQLLVESTVLAVMGGVAGLLLAVWGIAVTHSTLPPFIIEHIAGLKHLEVDRWVLGFTAAISLLTGLISGAAPALHASATHGVNETLKEGGRGASSGGGRHRLRGLLVVSEVALALVLLIGAGLMVKGFRALMNVDQGFDERQVFTFRITLPRADYATAAQRAAFFDQLMPRLEAGGGVESAAALSSLPSGWSWNRTSITPEGMAPPAPGELRITYTQLVTPDVFRALKIPLRAGRPFGPQDGRDTQPVAIIGESIARRYWPGQYAVGKRMKLSWADGEPWRTVVGVVGDIRTSSFDEPQMMTYVPVSQVPPASSAIAVRATSGDPLALAPAVRTQVAAVDPRQAIYDVRTLEQVIGDNVSGVQFSARMMIAFGVLALLLAAAGIYAVMSYSVAQRTHEIGVRMALGARPGDVLRMMVGYAGKLALAGLVIGFVLSIAFARALSGLMFGVMRMDAVIFSVFPAVLALVALLAGYIPARWATKVDPLIALRYE
jgi:putative ABC transport system permease protein